MGNRNLAFVALEAEKAGTVKTSGSLSLSESDSETLHVSLTTLSTGFFVGDRTLAFVALEAEKAGPVKISGSSSLSESDSESLTNIGMSKY